MGTPCVGLCTDRFTAKLHSEYYQLSHYTFNQFLWVKMGRNLGAPGGRLKSSDWRGNLCGAARSRAAVQKLCYVCSYFSSRRARPVSSSVYTHHNCNQTECLENLRKFSFWRARAPRSKNYVMFVHISPAIGRDPSVAQCILIIIGIRRSA